jgi:hypothetical protein
MKEYELASSEWGAADRSSAVKADNYKKFRNSSGEGDTLHSTLITRSTE